MCEVATIYRQGAHRARKPVACCECGRQIEPGEVYLHSWGVWEGTAEIYRTCAECWEVREDLREDMPSGYVYDEETACALAFGCLRDTLATEDLEVSREIRRTS
jgi:hypothetical protein